MIAALLAAQVPEDISTSSVGLRLAVVLVLVLMNFVYAFAAYPAGVLSDNANRYF